MPATKPYIKNIDQYCDNRCGMCPHTNHCRSFHEHLKTYSNQTDYNDLSIFLTEVGYSNPEKAEPGKLPEDKISEIEKDKTKREEAAKHICTEMSLEYLRLVDLWFEEYKDLQKIFLKETFIGLTQNETAQNIETVKWYQPHIYVKVSRAVYAKLKENENDCSDNQCDSNGSAKVALLGIQQSLNAYTKLIELIPETEDDIIRLVLHLNNLKKNILQNFPNALKFIRPGFDE